MSFPESFSRRHQYRGIAKDISIREDAPESLRVTVLETARQLDWAPSALRTVVCYVLKVRPSQSNWSEYPNIWDEVQYLVYDCDWFKVYDIIEALYERMMHDGRSRTMGAPQRFAAELNALFIEEGIGWQLVDGQVVTRGDDAFESTVHAAATALAKTARPTAAQHLREAIQALSRRPLPNCPGAIYHAMGALECVARDLTGSHKETLGEILKRRPDLVPKPLDNALSLVWGCASNEARHVVEGRNPDRDEAALVVGLAATITTYLSRKAGTS
jgi:hypothetical protein